MEFYKIGVLKTSAKFLGKLKCRRFFSIKLQTNNVETSIGLGGGDLNIINQWGYHEKGGDKIWNFSGEGKGQFWLKFSARKNLGGNYGFQRFSQPTGSTEWK